MTRVAVLTPPGSAAVAVLEVQGPNAWPVLQRLFRTAGGKTLNAPPASFAFGRIGEPVVDEIILAHTAHDTFEVQCHGGSRVLAALLALFHANGIEKSTRPPNDALRLLSQARTVRTASILLDQLHGAYDRAEEALRAGGPEAERMRALLHRNARVGRHLVEPWTVAIVGAPNVGKSSLLNALAGFDRSVVSPVPGTTRDAVSVSLACDGWPIDFIDTAGLRESGDAIEAEGVVRARAAAAASDLVLSVVDASSGARSASEAFQSSLACASGSADRQLVVLNKIDLVEVPAAELPGVVRVSAVTGDGLTELIARIVATLIPSPPQPGEPVPFTPEQCARWS
jgi:tRNA modification GTPase